VFDETRVLTVCLRCYVDNENRFAYRSLLTELRAAGIVLPKRRELWLETANEADLLNLAFELPISLIQNLLWCALVSDFGSIRPHPQCLVYLFDLETGLLVWPYDDRGMDVVGPNRKKLATLYHKYSSYLLDYDRAKMDETFGANNAAI